jgi:predicted PurR-regulated permease PerM
MADRAELKAADRLELTAKLRPLLLLAGFLLVIATLFWGRALLIPFALAVLLAFVLSPIVIALQHRGLRRSSAVFVVVVLAFSLLGGAGWAITGQLTRLGTELPAYQDTLTRKITALREAGRRTGLNGLRRAYTEVLGEIQKDDGPPPADGKPVPVVVRGELPILQQVVALLQPLARVGLVSVLVVFILIERQELRNRLIRLAGYRRLAVTTKALDEAGSRISRYLLTQSLINVGFGLVLAVGLLLIGVPYALLWGLVVATMRFIPFVGVWVAALFPVVLSLAVFDSWVRAALVIALFAAVEILVNAVAEPVLYSQRAGMSKVALLVAVAFWTWLWGPVGVILATPLTVCLAVAAKYVPVLDVVAMLLSDEPALETSVGYYQRLLAMDPAEATEIVEEHLKTHPRDEVYDRVLVPALNRARHDLARGRVSETEARAIFTGTQEILADFESELIEVTATGITGAQTRDPAPLLSIVGCAALDEGDEAGLIMLRQVLPRGRLALEIISPSLLSSEVLREIERQRPALVCIAAVPPGGLPQARHLSKRLRARLPGLRIVIGRWGLRDGFDEESGSLRAAGADDVGRSLIETRDQLMALIPTLAAAAPVILTEPISPDPILTASTQQPV